MTLIFDERVLAHKIHTGVENYTKYILKYLLKKIKINEVIPNSTNKYLSHLWTHFILPFKKGDILFCPANIAPIFVPKSKKLIVTLHDVAFITYHKSFSKFFRIYYNFVIPIVIQRADKIITISNVSKSEIIKYYPNAKDKIEVIPLGIDKKYKILNNIKKDNQILYVGSMNERKNFVSVIKAFELLNDKSCKLIMVGNFSSNFDLDEQTNEMLDNAKLNKDIIFKLNISDTELVKIYNQSKLLVFPSLYEGFGLPPLEAMACGTPVITSNISSMPEVCANAAIYCNPHNIGDIKDKIELVLYGESLQKNLIKKGLKKASEFSWEKSAQEHIKVFEEVMIND